MQQPSVDDLLNCARSLASRLTERGKLGVALHYEVSLDGIISKYILHT